MYHLLRGRVPWAPPLTPPPTTTTLTSIVYLLWGSNWGFPGEGSFSKPIRSTQSSQSLAPWAEKKSCCCHTEASSNRNVLQCFSRVAPYNPFILYEKQSETPQRKVPCSFLTRALRSVLGEKLHGGDSVPSDRGRGLNFEEKHIMTNEIKSSNIWTIHFWTANNRELS